MLDYLLEELRKKQGISKEQEEQLLEELKQTNPVTQLQQENDQLRKRVEASESAMLDLMDILMGGF